MKTSTKKANAKARKQDPHELLEQERFDWLAQVIGEVLSPYWSQRMENQNEGRGS